MLEISEEKETISITSVRVCFHVSNVDNRFTIML